MTIAEAVQLALGAASVGHPGEVFVLDMDQPVRILDLLTNLIKVSEQEPGDIRVNYSGIRPGERLHEELFLATEVCQAGSHPQILVAKNADTAEAETVARMVSLARHMQTGAAREQVQIPERLSRSPLTQPIYAADQLGHVYVNAQFRDSQGMEPPIYCDDIAAEGTP
jgi:FlaA1/EpsC-like NDP-sugar epimerase